MSEPVAHGAEAGLEDLLARHAAVFLDCYGAGARPRLFFSPGRVNLFGEHVDYNGGPVMPSAIDRGTFIAARPRVDRRVRFASTLDSSGLEIDLDRLPSSRLDRWADYPMGVLVDLVSRARPRGRDAGPGGLDVMFGGNLPIGAGLSSSASICVGTAYLLDRFWDLGLGVQGRVAAALRAERGFVGVQCGIMDPYAVGYARPGHLLWLDCKDESFEHLPLDGTRLSMLIAVTGVKRALAASAFNERVAQCREAWEILAPHTPGATCLRDVPPDVLEAHSGELAEVVRRRARHVVAEVVRTFAAREALLAGDIEGMGALMTETHRSLRDLYQCSCPELDVLVDAAMECRGAYGARLTGAGFGGCAVVLVARGSEERVREHLSRRFSEAFGRPVRVEVFAGDAGPREVVL